MNRHRLRLLVALAIAWMPFGPVRQTLYRLLMGYRMGARCKVGWGTVIAVDRFTAGDDVTIRRGTRFEGPISVDLGERTFIGRRNRIECGGAASDPRQAHMKYTRAFVTGRDSLINEGHLFDVLGTVRIGNGTWVAGFDSQFLTHGAGAMDRDITIGDDCFLGSAVRFAPGTGIGSRVILGMGSVVTKRIDADDAIVAGLPARVVRQRGENDDFRFTKVWMD